MQPVDVGIAILLVHGLLGAFDELYSHELDARLRHQPSAACELRLHAGRSGLYAIVFAGLAWFEWHGALVALLALLVLAEFALALADSVVEDRTREVSATERLVHMTVGVTTGAWSGFVFFTGFTDWWAQPTALTATGYGAVSWLLTAYAAAAGLFALRDTTAAARLDREALYLPPAALSRRRSALAGR